MRIARVELTPYACPLPAPWPPGEVRRGVILTLEEEAGLSGFGESAPYPGFNLETYASSVAALRLAAKYLVGMPRERYRDALSDLHRLAPVMASPCARHAIDLALHHLIAGSAETSIAGLLGDGRVRDEVPVNATLPRLPREELVEAAASAVAEGYRTLKIKVGGAPVAEDIERVRAVRERIGSDVRLRVDANRAWTETEAVRALRALEGAGLEYCEEPCSDPDAMRRVRVEVGVPLAADESVVDLDSARRLVETGAAQVLVLKPMALGGLRPACAIVALARESGVDLVVTTMLESPVGRLGALHLASSLGSTPYAHGLGVGCVPWPAPSKERATHIRPDVGRVLRIGRDDQLSGSFVEWVRAESDFEEVLQEENA